MNAHDEAQQALSRLTASQRRVALMKARGLTAKEIAEALACSEHTVKSHLYNAFLALEIDTSTQLAVLCTLAGEITTWKEAA